MISPSRTKRQFIALFALGVASALAPLAHSYDLGGATIEPELQLPNGDGGYQPQGEQEVQEYFNMANCLCDADFAVEYTINNRPPVLASEELQIWVGTNCAVAETDQRDSRCIPNDETISDVSSSLPATVAIDVRTLVSPLADPNSEVLDEICPKIDQNRGVFAIIDEDYDGIGEGDHSFPLDIAVDTQPPPEPDSPKATAGESAISVTWKPPQSNDDDIEFYQLLCARADEPENDDDKFPRKDITPRFVTARNQCEVDDGVFPTIPGSPEAVPTGLPDKLLKLHPDTVCGQAGATETSMRVNDLTNEVAYRVVLVTVDRAGNANAIDLGEVIPQPVADGWEQYKDAGGTAVGGCASTGGTSTTALLFIVLCVASLRKRGLLIVTLLVVGSSASAQPYWDEPQAVAESTEAYEPHWNFEFAAGRYLPEVDSEFDLAEGEEGPFEEMYGDKGEPIFRLSLDYFFLTDIGQLGVTGSAGFAVRNANAYATNEDGSVKRNANNKPIRSEGDTTSFKLIPTTLGIVYRLTTLDDKFRVPIVPYGRASLSYYIWWITQPDGSIAEAPTSDCPDAGAPGSTCTGDRARGGSLGWQVSLGIAVRAERFDPDTETALRTQLGIEHAGFFAEVMYANVDGFGAEEKLAVGDATWLAGINFEF